MRKEVIFAIVAGISIGLIFAFGIFRVNKTIQNDVSETSSESSSNTGNNTANENKNNEISLTLLRPSDQQTFRIDVIEISGMTNAGSYLVTTGGTFDNIIKTDDGAFTIDYEIDPSINNLNITSVNENNNRISRNLEVFYTSEMPSEGNEDKSDENDEADEESDIDNRIEEKIQKAQNTAEFFKGTITDLTSEGLQMKTENGEIRQISLSDSTTYARIAKSTTKLTVSDIAIGDYILALGYRKNNGLLNAFRILVTQPAEFTEIKVFYGTVTEKNKTDMVVEENNSGGVTIAIDNNSKTYKGDLNDPQKVRFADVSENDLVIGTYFEEDDENVARRIYILKSSDDNVVE